MPYADSFCLAQHVVSVAFRASTLTRVVWQLPVCPCLFVTVSHFLSLCFLISVAISVSLSLCLSLSLSLSLFVLLSLWRSMWCLWQFEQVREKYFLNSSDRSSSAVHTPRFPRMFCEIKPTFGTVNVQCFGAPSVREPHVRRKRHACTGTGCKTRWSHRIRIAGTLP